MIETERTLLKPIKLKDAQEVFSYRSDAVTNAYQGWIPKTLDEVTAFIAKNPKEYNQLGTWFQLTILEKNTNTVIGDIGVHFIDQHQSEIGCTLAKQYHGKGFATEALHQVIHHLFHDLNKHRIVTSIDPQNINSIKLVERLGFRKEAHIKKSILMNGKWVDDIVYAILKEEWS